MGSSKYTDDTYRPCVPPHPIGDLEAGDRTGTGKRRFSTAERYAVWSEHEQRCWLCLEPLEFKEATIDHVLPEALMEDVARRQEVFAEYGLTDDFQVNGFENWLPAHIRCNQRKSTTLLPFVPGTMLILKRLIRAAPNVRRTAERIIRSAATANVVAPVLVALERETISLDEVLQDLAPQLRPSLASPQAGLGMIKLDNGYWVREDEVVRQCICQCEREVCVGSDRKLYCLFSSALPHWVITKGLHWKCYDEVVGCSRCGAKHKRGHIGREGRCQNPYSDERNQLD